MKARRRKTAARKSHVTAKARPRSPSIARLEAKVARLAGDLNKALERQRATADILGAISRSKFELQSILQSVVDTASQLCRADASVIFRLEGGVYRFAAGYSLIPEYMEHERRNPISPGPGTLIGRAAVSRQVVQIEDAWTDPLYEQKAVAGVGRSMMGVPLMRRGEPIGVIGLSRSRVAPFTQREIDLVTTFADQAVIAIENARLFEAEQQRSRELAESLEQQTATSEVLRIISSSPADLEPVFSTMLENAVRICDAKFGVLYLAEGSGFRAAAMHNAPHAYQEARAGVVYPPPSSSLWQAANTKQAFQVADAMLEPGYRAGDPFIVSAVALGGYRSVFSVPMLQEDKLIGVVTIFRQEVRPFTDRQIALVANFGKQAVIAIENARLLNELRQRTNDLSEALEQQTATSNVLQVISSSPGDLEPVFATMLENAARLCGANFGNIFRWDGDALWLVATHNTPPAFTEHRRRLPFRPEQGNPIGEMLKANATIHVADLSRDERYVQRSDPDVIAAVELAGIRTFTAVPMLKNGNLIGAVILYRQEVRHFSEKQIELVQNFAAQAVIAIENARLLSELRQRTDELARSVEELRALGETSQTVNSTLDLETVLNTIVAKAVQLSSTEAGAIYVFDTLQREFDLRATYGMDRELITALKEHHIRLDEPIVAQVLAQPEPMQVADLREGEPSAVNEIIFRAGFRALLVTPLRGADDLVGMLVVRRRAPGVFRQNTVDLMKTFAAQSALAIQNARLFHEIEDKGRQLEIASQHKSQFLANMSHELRTPLNAILGYTELIADGAYGEPSEKMLEALKRLEVNGKHLLGLINDVLDLSKIEAGQLELELSDYSLEDIAQVVRSTLEPLAADKKLTFKVEMPTRLPPGHGDGRRLTQVLINLVGNAIKFTDAGEIAIKADANNGAFHVSVRDTGPGISAADQTKLFQEFQQADNAITKKKGGTGLGLAISKRIIEMHGGRIWVELRPGQGSTFAFTLPVTVDRQAGTA